MNSAFRVALRQFSTTVSARSGNVPAGMNEICCLCIIFIISPHTGYAQLKTKQKMFNLDNGLRVHQRGGMADAALYNTCVFLIFAGGALWLKTVYTLAVPQKN